MKGKNMPTLRVISSNARREISETDAMRHLQEVMDYLRTNKCDRAFFKSHLAKLMDISHANDWGHATYFLEKAFECLDGLEREPSGA
jgi:hypothetical protein